MGVGDKNGRRVVVVAFISPSSVGAAKAEA